MSAPKEFGTLVDSVLEGHRISREEALEVLSFPDERYAELVGEVSRVRRAFFGDRVKLNALVNIKSGLCPEDCNYCSQSKVSTAPIQKYPYLSTEEVMERAKLAREAGAKRLCLVASGRGPSEREVGRFAHTVREVKNGHPELEVCACLGLLRDGQADALKDAGVHAYNHNLNTSERVYGTICSTHTYADRQQTVTSAKEHGLSPCSGALFGMGETDDDIVDVAFALRDLEPDSVPINFLIPIEGTPLGDRLELTPQRCLTILALFRLVFPEVEVRIAGGREVHLRSLQPMGLLLANSIFVGDYLTTEGQEEDADLRMISDAGLTVESAGEATLPRERGLPSGGVTLKGYRG
jgi:biotin synthase